MLYIQGTNKQNHGQLMFVLRLFFFGGDAKISNIFRVCMMFLIFGVGGLTVDAGSMSTYEEKMRVVALGFIGSFWPITKSVHVNFGT